MTAKKPLRAGWAYYAAVFLFVAILAFALLGLVRSSSLAIGSSGPRPAPDAPAAQARSVPPGAVPTAQIPPPTRTAPTRPPSRTELHPASEAELPAAPPELDSQPRR